MSAEGQNLQAKYQKLAAEYAKLRAQNTVLKKAVIEEQEKTKTLQETAKQKDQSIRKYEQEIDSLQFRNDQLSKRVGILQDELDESGSKNWKSWANPAPSHSSVDSDVKEEELKIKIQENERLQRQLFDALQEHKATVSSLQERLNIAERSSSNHQKAIDEASDTHRMVVEKLQEDRALMEAKLRKTEEELRTLTLKAEKSQQRLKLLNNEISSKCENVSKIVAEKIPFNDTSNKELNSLNVPTHDRKHQVKSKELIGLAADLIKEFTSALSNLHTYTEQRIKTFYVESTQEQLSAQTQKFCSYLHENATVLRAVEHSFSSFYKELKTDSLITLETVSGLKGFSDAFHCYVMYLAKLMLYYFLSTEEECKSSTCSQTLEGYNRQVVSATAGMVRIFTKVDSYVQALASNKEHWMLECQLLQVKHEKESKKVASLEKELEKLKSSASADQANNPTSMSVPPSPTRKEAPIEPTDLGKVFSEATDESSDGMTRELLIKNHFTSRISDLTSQLQVMDSKGVSFAAECRSLYKRIRQSEKDRDGLSQKLLTANARVKQIEDELDVTKRNYETQLSMMSEHLCGMNEKLTTQQDEIELLKSGGKSKKSKK
ncbi:protein phosphatase 1 regulatory subunit 21-like [Actinia tenebrosa]|uniref:Protein phosphatase 1 regulatory subunit 21 n=1 Tax=Actinia tenebrosa TaxID=6105 RepID=A0A6P8I3P5_ACTTE|nr:protein phosphatase 1 regulatory subunit 21-like [Actinia tenebrosa]